MYALKNRKTGNYLYVSTEVYTIQHDYELIEYPMVSITLIDPEYTDVFNCAPLWTTNDINIALKIANHDYKPEIEYSDSFSRPMIDSHINIEDIEVVEIEVRSLFL